MTDETKYPWESKTELAAFAGLLFSMAATFGLNVDPELQGAIVTVVFALIMLIRAKYPGVKLALKK